MARNVHAKFIYSAHIEMARMTKQDFNVARIKSTIGKFSNKHTSGLSKAAAKKKQLITIMFQNGDN